MLTKTQTASGLTFTLDGHARLNAQMRACAAWATLEEHDKILDMACGSGALLCHLNARYRLTMCGMCDSPEQARQVRELLDDADIMYGRMDDIPWRSDTFDALLLPAAMRGDGRRVLEEAYRVLRAGGQMVIAVPLLSARGESEIGKREMMRVMQETGFKEVSYRISGLAGAIVGWKRKELKGAIEK